MATARAHARAYRRHRRPRHRHPCHAVLAPRLDPGRERLTRRQSEVLELLELGLTNAQIGSRLSVSPSTVKTMLERLYRRAGVSGRVALLLWSRRDRRDS